MTQTDKTQSFDTAIKAQPWRCTAITTHHKRCKMPRWRDRDKCLVHIPDKKQVLQTLLDELGGTK